MGVLIAPEPRRSPVPFGVRFAWGAAATGLVLFLSGMVGVFGSWSVSVGALSLTVASIAGVIAMEGREELTPAPPAVLDRPLTRST
jgi:hypothetical protein